MASSSKDGSSLRPNRTGPEGEAWKTAPSRETTHADPGGKDQKIERARKPLENAPGSPAPGDEEGSDS
jgi:hypothetical protein